MLAELAEEKKRSYNSGLFVLFELVKRAVFDLFEFVDGAERKMEVEMEMPALAG